MSSRGVVAAGHPETAAAGAWALREGGNAVDAAIAAVAASLAAESPLTGLGAGGYMLVHEPDSEPALLDFFVSAPGFGARPRRSELEPVEVDFGGTIQIFNVGAASCGVPGVPSGLADAATGFGSMPLADLLAPGVRLAREGVEVNPQQAYLHEILAPILTRDAVGAGFYAPRGRTLAAGERISFPELAETLELLGREGPEPFYRGAIAAAIADRVLEAGGSLAPEDLAAYETIRRAPVRARFRDREILTNPPPSSGGILIAFALEVLDRLGEAGTEALVAAMDEAQAARTPEFLAGLYEEGFERRFLTPEAIAAAAERCRPLLGPGGGGQPGSRLGSTTHITAVDGDGGCASVTCSNGTGSGIFVADTAIHLNNMLGEDDLNPFGFHATGPGRRMPSMMSPTVVLREGSLELGLGSGGSNRIRSAITQTIVRYLTQGLDIAAAVSAPRVHAEAGVVHAEPGVEAAAIGRLGARGYQTVSWEQPNLFFGGVHAVARGPAGTPRGAGDPRRGGAVAVA